MNTAAELLDVIEASHLTVNENLQASRGEVLQRIGRYLDGSSANESGNVAAGMAQWLVEAGIVLADLDSVQEVIAEYLQVVADETETLGDEEKQFLDNFLK